MTVWDPQSHAEKEAHLSSGVVQTTLRLMQHVACYSRQQQLLLISPVCPKAQCQVGQDLSICSRSHSWLPLACRKCGRPTYPHCWDRPDTSVLPRYHRCLQLRHGQSMVSTKTTCTTVNQDSLCSPPPTSLLVERAIPTRNHQAVCYLQ